MQITRVNLLLIALAALSFTSCTNNPHRPGETATSTYFGAFSTPPTKLDPTSAYYVHEGRLIDQIYEPPFAYHYLKRPYELVPQTAVAIPSPVYYDADGQRLDQADPPSAAVARAEYTIEVRPDICYQDHPCFATNAAGQPAYAGVTADDIAAFDYPSAFTHQGTRALRAEDYALQIRRLADPRLASPVFSTLAEYILGLDALHEQFVSMLEAERDRRREAGGPAYNQEQDERGNPIRLDYMAPPLPGVEIVDTQTYRVILKRKYPQILYWMCMHFFCPIPQEALDFYEQPAMVDKQFSLMRCPVGTGPYFMRTFRPNALIVLERNPNYHDDVYPSEGAPGDREAGLLADAGRRLPFIDRQVLSMEKESIPAWNKFLQGYTDASAIASDVFDQAIQMQTGEDPTLSDAMRERGIHLVMAVDTTLFYTTFNMLDDVVGYLDENDEFDERKSKLRRAISIALDYNEFLDIFANGRGIQAQGPIPPGIFGYRGGAKGTNPFVDAWDPQRQRHVRRPIEAARTLMEEAGYPGGIGPDGKPLTLHFDHSAQTESFFRSYFDWMRRRLGLIGVRLKDRGTDLSRYREKRDKGNWQMASGGWLADYPDPENFLFLFYGPNGKVKSGGANATNYENPEFDELFREMENMQNSPERQALIDRMMSILQRDAPAVWQYHPVSYALQHAWYHNAKPHQMSYNIVKYRRIDPGERVRMQEAWNRPVTWPLTLLAAVLVIGSIPAAITVYRRERGR